MKVAFNPVNIRKYTSTECRGISFCANRNDSFDKHLDASLKDIAHKNSLQAAQSRLQHGSVKYISNQVTLNPEMKMQVKLEKIYNDVYDKTIKNNPAVKLLNYSKPKIKAEEEPFKDADPGLIAMYSFLSNSIKVNPKFFEEDYFIAYTTDKKGYVNFSQSPQPRENLSLILQDGFEHGIDYKVEKLSQGEKDIYLKSILAHELQHSLQDHLAVSTEGCSFQVSKVFEMNNVILAEALAAIQTTIENYEKRGYKAKPEEYKLRNKTGRILRERQYSIEYEPKKILDKDTLSVFKNPVSGEKYAFSVREHLATSLCSHMRLSEKIAQPEIYLADPREIEAHYKAAEILLGELKERSASLRDVRRSVLLALVGSQLENAYTGMSNLEKAGYPPVINPDNV